MVSVPCTIRKASNASRAACSALARRTHSRGPTFEESRLKTTWGEGGKREAEKK